MGHLCNDYGDRPGCLREADDRYTMSFEDIGEGCIYWCAKCGPEAHAMNQAITEAFATRPGFQEEFAAAIKKAEDSTVVS